MAAADQCREIGMHCLDASLRWHDGEKAARLDRDLSRLLPNIQRIGVAVSGGPDSLALLLLATSVRPGRVEAATVDHGLRPDSAAEARMVADICDRLEVPHATLPVTVTAGASLQAHAREARYAALAEWAGERRLAAILTGHHADDQAETLLMRLARGAGLGGLAGIRAVNSHGEVPILRPLLGWRKGELESIVRSAGLAAVDDPANSDPRHDRTSARAFLAAQTLLNPERLADSASHLAEAEEALVFTARQLFAQCCRQEGAGIRLDIAELPRELQRRLLLLAFAGLNANPPRGRDLDRALTVLANGRTCTLAGIKLEGGASWRLSPAPPRVPKPSPAA